MALGTFFVGLAIIGIFLPLLPTTPFLLLAAACYARSSERLSNWLFSNKFFGRVLKSYRDGRGIPLRWKIFTIILLWLTIGSLVAFELENLIVQILLLVIASAVTIHLLIIPTAHYKD